MALKPKIWKCHECGQNTSNPADLAGDKATCNACFHRKTLTCDDLIAALQAHKAKHGNTLVAFRGNYGADETRGVCVIEDPVRIPGKAVRDYDEWERQGKPMVIWTNIMTG